MLGSAKRPTPNVIVQTIAKARMNVAAAANTGRQRATKQRRIGANKALGRIVNQ
jgi:hypothetical protein